MKQYSYLFGLDFSHTQTINPAKASFSGVCCFVPLSSTNYINPIIDNLHIMHKKLYIVDRVQNIHIIAIK